MKSSLKDYPKCYSLCLSVGVTKLSHCVEPPTKEGRGRPKGSERKNTIFIGEERITTPALAEAAVDIDTESSFLDSGDVCGICYFAFNRSIKRGKVLSKCNICRKKCCIRQYTPSPSNKISV